MYVVNGNLHLVNGNVYQVNIYLHLDNGNTVKPILSGHSNKTKKSFQDHKSLNAGQKYCRMWSILQYF